MSNYVSMAVSDLAGLGMASLLIKARIQVPDSASTEVKAVRSAQVSTIQIAAHRLRLESNTNQKSTKMPIVVFLIGIRTKHGLSKTAKTATTADQVSTAAQP